MAPGYKMFSLFVLIGNALKKRKDLAKSIEFMV
jgi:hypothetical protein